MNWREKWQEKTRGGFSVSQVFDLDAPVFSGESILVVMEGVVRAVYSDGRYNRYSDSPYDLLPVQSPPQVVPFTFETAPDDILRVRWKRSGGAGCCVFAVNKSGVIRISGATATKCITWDVLCRECEILRLSTGWVSGGEVKK